MNVDSKEKLFESMVSKRRIPIFEPITQDMVGQLINLIEAMSLENDGPIEIRFNCPGGDVEAVLSLCDVIEHSKIEFHGLVMRKCASAAMLVFQACHKREALSNVQFMIHEVSREVKSIIRPTEQSLAEAHTKVDEFYKTVTLMSKKVRELILQKVPDDKRSLFEQYFKTGEYFCADTALELGLVSAVI